MLVQLYALALTHWSPVMNIGFSELQVSISSEIQHQTFICTDMTPSKNISNKNIPSKFHSN